MDLMAPVKKSFALKVSLSVGTVMLVLLCGVGYYLVSQQNSEHRDTMDDFLYKKAKMASVLGAQMYGTILEEAIDNGALTTRETFDRDYEIIPGHEWGEKPKYHTAYDSVTDKAVLLFQDRFLEDPDFVFAVGVDVNGYLPTHNTRFQKKITGDKTKDLAGNRTKRVFDDPVGIEAAKNTEPGHRKVYKRDTGELLWDVSTPVYVKGQHWGGFRVGVNMIAVEAASAVMVRKLSILFGTFALVVLVILFLYVNFQMKPVVQLSAIADAISSGEHLDRAVPVRSQDEIGILSKSLDRLRLTVKAALERLGA